MSTINSTTSNYINSYFKNNRALTSNDFKNTNLVTYTKTNKIEDTILVYNLDLGIIFCSICRTNLTISNYLIYLSTKYKELYKSYKNNNILSTLESKINTLELSTLEELENKIANNKFLFKELDISLNNYKCLECNYTSITSKQIRKHYSKKHSTSTIKTNLKAPYIIENIPL